MFPDPNEFRPERFLDGEDPMFAKFTLSFGFGRRICPGMHIAQQSLFILISRYVIFVVDLLVP
jgi:cytochrome P450